MKAKKKMIINSFTYKDDAGTIKNYPNAIYKITNISDSESAIKINVDIFNSTDDKLKPITSLTYTVPKISYNDNNELITSNIFEIFFKGKIEEDSGYKYLSHILNIK